MDPEERPNKIRRLETQGQSTSQSQSEETASLFQRPDQTVIPQAEHSKPQEHAAANDADTTLVDSESETRSDFEIQAETQTNGEEPSLQNCGPAQPISKNQLKKLRKQQAWDAGRDYRKAKRKQKIQEKKQRKREAKEEEDARQQSLQQNGDGEVLLTSRHPRPRGVVVLPVTILIDCGFDDLMTEKERISLGSQLTRSYSDNWRAPFKTHLVLSSWGGLLKDRFDTVLRKHYLNWKGVTFEEADFVQAAQHAGEVMRGPKGGKLLGIFQSPTAKDKSTADSIPKNTSEVTNDTKSSTIECDTLPSETTITATAAESVDSAQNHRPAISQPPSLPLPSPDSGEIIYLTSDSPNTLSTLRPYSTYIVGGLVDKNRHKGICYRVACERGVKTAKLPIGEYLEMQSRKVLTTNHVVEIMIRYLECGDWGEAFLKVIPKRKGGKLREKSNGEIDHDDGVDDDDDDDDDSVGAGNLDEVGDNCEQ